MLRMGHELSREQTEYLSQSFVYTYACYGIAGNFPALQRVHRAVEGCRRKMLSSRSWKGQMRTNFHQSKDRFPLHASKL